VSTGRIKRGSGLSTLSRRPLPEVARRLRASFPELWTRYRVIESSRDFDEVRPAPSSGRNRPARSS